MILYTKITPINLSTSYTLLPTSYTLSQFLSTLLSISLQHILNMSQPQILFISLPTIADKLTVKYVRLHVSAFCRKVSSAANFSCSSSAFSCNLEINPHSSFSMRIQGDFICYNNIQEAVLWYLYYISNTRHWNEYNGGYKTREYWSCIPSHYRSLKHRDEKIRKLKKFINLYIKEEQTVIKTLFKSISELVFISKN